MSSLSKNISSPPEKSNQNQAEKALNAIRGGPACPLHNSYIQGSYKQPKQRILKGKNPQNDHRFALFHSSNMSNLMTPDEGGPPFTYEDRCLVRFFLCKSQHNEAPKQTIHGGAMALTIWWNMPCEGEMTPKKYLRNKSKNGGEKNRPKKKPNQNFDLASN